MAWNDPGKNENPWQRKPDQGPPDLDEVLRRVQKKLRALFGGGPRPIGSGGDGRDRAFGVGYVVAGLLVIWAMTGLYTNEQAERSVITRFGKYVGDHGGGHQLAHALADRPALGGQRHRVRELPDRAAHADAGRGAGGYQARRAVPAHRPGQVHLQRARSRGDAGEVSESAIREVIGQSNLNVVLETGRTEISRKTKELIQRTIDRLQHRHRGHQRQPAGRQRSRTRSRPRRRMRPRRARTRTAPAPPPRPTRATSCRKRAAARSAWWRKPRPTRRGSSRTRKARPRASSRSRKSTSGRRASRASASTWRRSRRCSASSTKVLVDTERQRQHDLPAARQADRAARPAARAGTRRRR